MSVLIECYNVIVKREAIEEKYPGGLDAYRAICLKLGSTFCADEHLTRMGFMSREDLRGFAKHVLSAANLGVRPTAISSGSTAA